MTTLVEEINGQTDRGAAIVAAAWLEEALSAALESVLHQHKTSWQRLFAGNGPLTTFSAKIDLCRLLGMLTDMVRADLHIIRDVRNEFAHQIAHKEQHTKLSFETTHIRDKCFALNCVKHEEIDAPRAAFVRACAVLYADFEMVRFFRAKLSGTGQIHARIEQM